MPTAQSLSTTASITVLKPAAEVFNAVRTPVPYFVAKASGPLAEGTTVDWRFPEMPGIPAPVDVKAVVPNKLIRLEWDAETGGKNSCEFTFADLDAHGTRAAAAQGLANTPATTVTVTESGWPDNEAGRKAALGNTMGWTQMLCCLKAWLEHGVNLRRGAFLHYKFPDSGSPSARAES